MMRKQAFFELDREMIYAEDEDYETVMEALSNITFELKRKRLNELESAEA